MADRLHCTACIHAGITKRPKGGTTTTRRITRRFIELQRLVMHPMLLCIGVASRCAAPSCCMVSHGCVATEHISPPPPPPARHRLATLQLQALALPARADGHPPGTCGRDTTSDGRCPPLAVLQGDLIPCGLGVCCRTDSRARRAIAKGHKRDRADHRSALGSGRTPLALPCVPYNPLKANAWTNPIPLRKAQRSASMARIHCGYTSWALATRNALHGPASASQSNQRRAQPHPARSVRAEPSHTSRRYLRGLAVTKISHGSSSCRYNAFASACSSRLMCRPLVLPPLWLW